MSFRENVVKFTEALFVIHSNKEGRYGLVYLAQTGALDVVIGKAILLDDAVAVGVRFGLYIDHCFSHRNAGRQDLVVGVCLPLIEAGGQPVGIRGKVQADGGTGHVFHAAQIDGRLFFSHRLRVSGRLGHAAARRNRIAKAAG